MRLKCRSLSFSLKLWCVTLALSLKASQLFDWAFAFDFYWKIPNYTKQFSIFTNELFNLAWMMTAISLKRKTERQRKKPSDVLKSIRRQLSSVDRRHATRFSFFLIVKKKKNCCCFCWIVFLELKIKNKKKSRKLFFRIYASFSCKTVNCMHSDGLHVRT